MKNKISGSVKTRIAQEKGDTIALQIYEELLRITRQNCTGIQAKKIVYYSERIDANDEWRDSCFTKKLQRGHDLGARMQHAFERELKEEDRVILIGSDCPGLTADHIEQAFRILNEHDVVLGPSKDGGYYLIGLKQRIPNLFKNISWSTDKVLKQTIERIENKQWRYALLEELSDIDFWSDWEQYLNAIEHPDLHQL